MNTHLRSQLMHFCSVLGFYSALLHWRLSMAGATGTAEDPYQIWTPEQMNTVGLHPEDWEYGKHFEFKPKN